MVNIFSRNTMVENRHTGTMIVEAVRRPAGSEVMTRVIPPGSQKYISYNDLHIQYNKCFIDVYVYVEGASEEDKKLIMSSMIRDNEKLQLDYENGAVTVTPIKGNKLIMSSMIRDNEKLQLDYENVAVTVTPIKGNMIAMNGFIIKLKHAAKKILGE